MLFKLLICFVVIALDGRVFDGSVHPLDLSVRPRMINFRQTVFYFVLTTNAVEKVHKRPFIFDAVGKLNTVVGQNRVNAIRHDFN